MEDRFKRLCDTLVERGFAHACLYDDTAQTVRFRFTPAGEQLRQHLRQLFGVPAVPPASLTSQAIADLVMVILFTPPPGPILEPNH